MFTKEDILSRLHNGENMDDIGNEIANILNEAEADYAAEQAAKAEQEEAKRDLIKEMVEIIQELAILEGFDPKDMEVSEEEVDYMVDAFTEIFATIRDLKKVFNPIKIDMPAEKSAPRNNADDQILADFLKSLI